MPALMAVEYAPPGKRGLYGSAPQIGLGLGLALGAGAFAQLGVVMDDAGVGWRIAGHIAAVILVFIGLVVRLKVMETAAFQGMTAAAEALPGAGCGCPEGSDEVGTSAGRCSRGGPKRRRFTPGARSY